MEATESDSVEPTNMDKSPETNRQLPPHGDKPSGAEHPFVKGKTLRKREPIIMKVNNEDGSGEKEVEIFPAEHPLDDFIAIDMASGDRIDLKKESDRSFAKEEVSRNPFEIPRRK